MPDPVAPISEAGLRTLDTLAHSEDDPDTLRLALRVCVGEIRRLREVERSALQLLPFLPPARQHSIPANNLRVALGVLGRKEDPESLAVERRERGMVAATYAS